MASNETPTTLAELLTRSGLLSEEIVRDLRSRFPQRTSTRRQLAVLLLERGLLTPWQLGKLMHGKYEGFFLGSYKLRSHLARGGMSTLYAAEHVASGAHRALKVLPPDKAEKHSYLPRFLREARLASELRHQNIARVFEVVCRGNEFPFHFMVMELLHGRDLFRCVAEDGPFSVIEAADVMRQAADGLHFAHQQGLVHRDVKPGNVFLTNSGDVKIIDFGLASVSETFDENITRDFDERMIGTADYLAPEQAIDSHDADHRADIYALGCAFYYLLTGQPPFTSGSLAQRILDHQSKTPQDPRDFRNDIPDVIHALLNAMLVKDRTQRIQTAALVSQQLTTWLEKTRTPPPCPSRQNADRTLMSCARKLKRIVPVHRRQQFETPTDSIRAAETRTEQPETSPYRSV